ncbi:FliM/FliN family flagellar motor switch protein [Buchnera aphidicola]|uniref:Flagellar motor switch protein FliM n=1 Tax=Buchnera aphidicola (Artemisaphis artemisicola) TaxID=1241836 RepID=A0A4D6XH91_9GAMM|nr:FliM/FliN family flagellar motor switch protein [Buchnera aphidicola]QCI15772.1 flagellar motor switch protein FliM [Buchnera aphidicola (Artemisaphis artemisicola)]
MAESSNFHNKIKKIYQREKEIYNFLKEDQIQMLEDINFNFIEKFIIDFSNFIKNSVELVSFNIQVRSYNFNKDSIQNFKYYNTIDISPYKNQSFIVFSCNFLSVIIDILFGGQGCSKNNFHKKIDITSTEVIINNKINEIIINILSHVYKKHFSSEVKFTNTKIINHLKDSNFDSNKIFLINYFKFNINHVRVSFRILMPFLIFKKINNKKISLNINKTRQITLNDIRNVTLNIIFKINKISISCEKFYSLSVGDILSIQNPNNITGYINNVPILTGKYRRFHEQSIFFIEEFIDSHLECNINKDESHE